MTKTIDLFLSHNRADKPWTARLAAAVEADRDGPPLGARPDRRCDGHCCRLAG
jgi:hypothetical protein